MCLVLSVLYDFVARTINWVTVTSASAMWPKSCRAKHASQANACDDELKSIRCDHYYQSAKGADKRNEHVLSLQWRKKRSKITINDVHNHNKKIALCKSIWAFNTRVIKDESMRIDATHRLARTNGRRQFIHKMIDSLAIVRIDRSEQMPATNDGRQWLIYARARWN